MTRLQIRKTKILFRRKMAIKCRLCNLRFCNNLINTGRKIPLLIKQTQGGVNYSVPRLAFYFSKHDTIYTRQSCLSNKFPLILHGKYRIFSPMIVHAFLAFHTISERVIESPLVRTWAMRHILSLNLSVMIYRIMSGQEDHH